MYIKDFKAAKAYLLVSFCLCCIFCSHLYIFAETGTWAEISLEEAYTRYAGPKDSALWIDARSRSHYEKGHIKGAISIPAHLLKYYLDYIPKDKEIILYCGSAACGASSTAAAILINSGFSQDKIKVFRAGYSGWTGAGYPTGGI